MTLYQDAVRAGVASEAEFIAALFSYTLRDWLTETEWNEMRQRNTEYGKNVCASHDYCDANMAMQPAFQRVTGRVPDPTSDADAALWTEAWDIAKRSYLTA